VICRKHLIAAVLALVTMVVALSGLVNVRAALAVVVVAVFMWRIASRASEWRR